MKNKTILLLFAAMIASLWSCSFSTRVERDVYTISERDTTDLHFIQNAPGNRDNGVVFPSTRTFKSSRYLLQQDSVVVREYPDFIRLGAFESVGFLVGGDKDYAMGTGLFGVYPRFAKAGFTRDRGNSDNTFVGGLWRLGIGEWRLRWFRDAKNWTIGTSMFEYIAPDSRFEKSLSSIFPIYIRKRYFLRDEIPYVCVTPAFGLGYYPSQYLNASVSLDVGSIGGLNLRAYAGLAAGMNPQGAPQIKDNEYTNEAQSSTIPYIGIGVSVLDFHNIVPETYVEWKDHPHSSWNIGLMQLGIIKSGTDYTVFSQDLESGSFNGFILKLANASVALPLDFLDNKLYAGTSLANLVVLGKNQYGIGILPIRIGFWQTIIADELSTEPFVEYNYYPSSFFHLGNRLNLRISDVLNISFLLGFASGDTSVEFGNDITDEFGLPGSFSSGYAGISINVADRIFFPEELRYNK